MGPEKVSGAVHNFYRLNALAIESKQLRVMHCRCCCISTKN